MVYGDRPHPRLPTLGGFGGGAPPPDLLALLAVVFVTFTLQYFAEGLVALLRLTPLVWRLGFVWQLVTYPLAGYGPASIWFLLELLILFWFGRDVFQRLGRRGFWRLLALGAVGAGVLALAVDAAMRAAGTLPAAPLALMQGQRMLLVMLVAAFATLYGRATIYLFFILPVQARWFLPIEILIAFMGYLTTRDLAGFLGICAAVALVWWRLRQPGAAGRGGRLGPREAWLRTQRWWMQQRLRRLRRRRGFTVVPGDRGRGPLN